MEEGRKELLPLLLLRVLWLQLLPSSISAPSSSPLLPKGLRKMGGVVSREVSLPRVCAPRDEYRGWQPNPPRRTERNYTSLEEVTEALASAGLESSNLIVGIDSTKSNEWTGESSFNRQSLHQIGGEVRNPYEQAISIIGRTLSAFDEDNLIPCFGFGDASTHDHDVFSFYADKRPCNGFEEVLSRYRQIAPQLRLAGPTSFAPIIEMAMTIVEQSGGQYHVLLIIADGQVTRSADSLAGQLSSQEQKTVDAIVRASKFPLSIVLVGVGDGPWDMMMEFVDNVPGRAFDNFQFVNFTDIMSRTVSQSRKEAEFALAALMKIPSQYQATLANGSLGHPTERSLERVPLPPPIGGDVPPPSVVSTAASGSDMLVKVGTAGMTVAFTAFFHLMFTRERLMTAIFTLCLCYFFGQASALCGLRLRLPGGVVLERREDPRPEDNQTEGAEPTSDLV